MTEKKIVVIIPARMGSTRYPGKPIVDVCGLSMIEHVWQRVRLNKRISAVYIATCDQEIKDVAETFGAEVIMTSDQHTRCTDRVAEACQKILASGKDFDIAINIQGDEPLLNPATLDLLIDPFIAKKDTDVVNLIEELNNDEVENDNNVKTVVSQDNFALYFSRLPIPTSKDIRHYKQLGVYAFSKKAILKYADMDETPLEIAESCDMLRFIENGIPVLAPLSPYVTKGVDTPADHDKVNKIMAQDEIFKKYHKGGN